MGKGSTTPYCQQRQIKSATDETVKIILDTADHSCSQLHHASVLLQSIVRGFIGAETRCCVQGTSSQAPRLKVTTEAPVPERESAAIACGSFEILV